MDHTAGNLHRILHDELIALGFSESEFEKIFLTTDEGSNIVSLIDSQHRCSCHIANTIIKRTTTPYQRRRNEEDVYEVEVRSGREEVSQAMRDLESFIIAAR